MDAETSSPRGQLQWEDLRQRKRDSRKIIARARIGNYTVEKVLYTDRPSFSCRFRACRIGFANSFTEGMRLCDEHFLKERVK